MSILYTKVNILTIDNAHELFRAADLGRGLPMAIKHLHLFIQVQNMSPRFKTTLGQFLVQLQNLTCLVVEFSHKEENPMEFWSGLAQTGLAGLNTQTTLLPGTLKKFVMTSIESIKEYVSPNSHHEKKI